MVEESQRDGFPPELPHVARCVRGVEQPVVVGEDGRAVLQIVLAADQVAGEGHAVTWPHDPPPVDADRLAEAALSEASVPSGAPASLMPLTVERRQGGSPGEWLLICAKSNFYPARSLTPISQIDATIVTGWLNEEAAPWPVLGSGQISVQADST
jgi:hypothetical protein